MIAVDTNVLVRFLVRDDEKQAQAVRRRLQHAEQNRERLFIPLPVLLETVWVLESAYDMARSAILDALRDMRHMTVFEFEAVDVVERFLADGDAGKADMADLLIAHSARAAGCDKVITFDRGAARHPFVELLK
ncbi:MAG TPA: type II toxin-antitoxin system VapC family toxin [Kiritimatiellia bacterium]|nr:type II toxin-antitoxin system VapC family toxin [Kiritimatiellia bacterium]